MIGAQPEKKIRPSPAEKACARRKAMPFKIKDLMINVVPSESGEGTGECVTGKKTNNEDGCTGKRTDVGCTGKRTDVGCTGKRTDVAICVGGRTEIELCVGGNSYGGGRPGQGPVPACARCTVKSHQIFSFKCDPEEVLEELIAIKAELQAELAAVDEEIKEVEDSLHPQTVGEVEKLQTKLQEALDELGQMKTALEKKEIKAALEQK